MDEFLTNYGIPFGQAIGFAHSADIESIMMNLDDTKRSQVLAHMSEFQSKEEMQRFAENLKTQDGENKLY